MRGPFMRPLGDKSPQKELWTRQAFFTSLAVFFIEIVVGYFVLYWGFYLNNIFGCTVQFLYYEVIIGQSPINIFGRCAPSL